jgi:hypothetical protein
MYGTTAGRSCLGELLGRPVQEPDVRVRALDHLAVELEHEPQHAVGRGMLGPEVHGVVADFSHRLMFLFVSA